VALRLGMDPLVFLGADGIEKSIREAVVLAAEKNRLDELRAFMDALAHMLGASKP